MGGAAQRSCSSFCRLLSKRRGQNKRFAGRVEQWNFKFCTAGWGFPYKPVQMMVLVRQSRGSPNGIRKCQLPQLTEKG